MKPRKLVTFGLLILLVISGVVGYNSFKWSGLEWRFSKTLTVRQAKVDCPVFTLCVLGNQSSEDGIFLFGDSHAAQLSNALIDELGDKYKIYFYWAQGCFFGDRELVPHQYNQPSYCGDIPSKIRGLGPLNIKIMIAAQKYPGYGIKTKEEIKEAVFSKFSTYQFNPEKMILLGSTRDVDFKCESQKFFKSAIFRNANCLSSEESDRNNQIFIDVTQRISLPKNTYFLYPFLIVGTCDSCNVIKDGVSMYEDSSHLSYDGALLVIGQIKEILRR